MNAQLLDQKSSNSEILEENKKYTKCLNFKYDYEFHKYYIYNPDQVNEMKKNIELNDHSEKP